jgi:pimeloyl-ACP methyl ester carboxylesterase
MFVSPILLSSLPSALSEAGHQRFWSWRGWRIRYWFHPGPAEPHTEPPLLLIHGFGANLNQWRHNLPALSQVAPVYALDLLGFGDTEKAATLYGAELWAAQVVDFIRSVVCTPVLLIGHSLGALVALTVAHHHSDWVTKLLMVTVPLPASREDLVAGWVSTLALKVESLFSTPLLMRPLFSLVRRPSFLRRALLGIYTIPGRVDEELLNLFALPPQERGAARTLCYLVRSRTDPNFSPSIKGMMASLSIPTLLLWGQQDRVIPVAFAQNLAALSSHLEIQLLPEVGHCLYDEDPDTFNQWVITWATSSPEPGSALAE